jgi:hypothetical protein
MQGIDRKGVNMHKTDINIGTKIGPGLYSLGSYNNVGFLNEGEIHRIAQGVDTLKRTLIYISNGYTINPHECNKPGSSIYSNKIESK